MPVSKTLNKEVILQTFADHKKELSEFGVEKIGLFGSFVSDDHTSDSDIDLLVDIRFPIWEADMGLYNKTRYIPDKPLQFQRQI